MSYLSSDKRKFLHFKNSADRSPSPVPWHWIWATFFQPPLLSHNAADSFVWTCQLGCKGRHVPQPTHHALPFSSWNMTSASYYKPFQLRGSRDYQKLSHVHRAAVSNLLQVHPSSKAWRGEGQRDSNLWPLTWKKRKSHVPVLVSYNIYHLRWQAMNLFTVSLFLSQPWVR